MIRWKSTIPVCPSFVCFCNKGNIWLTVSSKSYVWCLRVSFCILSRVILWILKNLAVSWLLCRITRRWIDFCFKPWCNPLWLTGLKAPTNYLIAGILCRILLVMVWLPEAAWMIAQQHSVNEKHTEKNFVSLRVFVYICSLCGCLFLFGI